MAPPTVDGIYQFISFLDSFLVLHAWSCQVRRVRDPARRHAEATGGGRGRKEDVELSVTNGHPAETGPHPASGGPGV